MTNGDSASFERRLAWDGLDGDTASRALVAPPLSSAEEAPAWAETFDAVLATMHLDQPDGEADRACLAGAPLPFETLLLPFVTLARSRTAERAGADITLFSQEAHAVLERALLRRLTAICARALYAEFSVYRSCRQQGSLAALFGDRPTSMFAAFVDEMRNGQLREFFARHAVAARLCARVTDLWIDTVEELVGRLAADLHAIEAAFNHDAPLGVVASIRTNMSDPHEGGRGVMILTWDNGLSVVYKPRPVGLETCFGDLVRWVNERTDSLELRALGVVQRPTHGWIEFAQHTPCVHVEEAERYFERCGMLLCLAYVMNGSDFHFENLIAVGEHPMLIDMETLLGHHFELVERVADQALAGRAARQQAMESVLNVRLLPLLRVSNGRAFEVGGLGGPGDAGGAGAQMATLTYWKHPNTDTMKLDQAQVPMAPGGDNLPLVGGVRVDAGGHVDAIVSGFTRVYNVLLSHAGTLLTDQGPLTAFRTQRVRFILRNTSLYAAVLERCLHPRFLHHGVDRGIQFDALSRVLLTIDPRPSIWPIVEAEHHALEQMDIPLFMADAQATSLTLPTGVEIPDCFRSSAYDQVIARVNRLSRRDLDTQSEIIRGSFRANAAHDLIAISHDVPAPRDAAAHAAAATDPAALDRDVITAACTIAERLRATSLTYGAEASWLGIGYIAEARRYMLGAMSSSLFDGYAGIALFLAAVERVTNGAGFRALALAAATPLRTRLDELAQTVRMRRTVEIGAATGLGSLIHALVRIGELLDEPDMLRDAERIAAVITPRVADAENPVDVMSGAAGGILALLTLHRANGHDGTLDLARTLATRLLARRTIDAKSGMRVWSTRFGHAETGFAHGQAGIAYALVRLAHLTGDDALRDAAAEAVAYERVVLGEHLCGARDMEARAAWSRGATGIGLARLGSLSAADTPGARAEIDDALAMSRGHLLTGVDSLCCGVAGRMDFLIAAASRLQRPELLLSAHDTARSLLGRIGALGHCNSGWDENQAWQVGLFHGAPGVGYMLLRVCHPTILPSVLLWS